MKSRYPLYQPYNFYNFYWLLLVLRLALTNVHSTLNSSYKIRGGGDGKKIAAGFSSCTL